MLHTSTSFNVELFESLTTSLVDSDAASPERYRAKLVVNAPSLGLKVFSALEEELKNTDREFLLSAAFITLAGVRPFLNTFSELEKRGVPGRILTTDYKLFTDPAALNRLLQFKNIEVRMHHSGLSSGFHAKAYLFSSARFESIILGSSNLTQAALFSNIEWNIQLASSEKGELAQRMRREFEMLWRSASDLSNPDAFRSYEERHRIARPMRPEEAGARQLVKEANDRIAEESHAGKIHQRSKKLKGRQGSADFCDWYRQNNGCGACDEGARRAQAFVPRAPGGDRRQGDERILPSLRKKPFLFSCKR